MITIRCKTVFVLMAVSIIGCSSSPSLDSRFGHAVNAAKAQQTINPDASRNTDPVTGIDGTSAKYSIDEYQDTFKKPPEPTIQIFGITGGSGR